MKAGSWKESSRRELLLPISLWQHLWWWRGHVHGSCHWGTGLLGVQHPLGPPSGAGKTAPCHPAPPSQGHECLLATGNLLSCLFDILTRLSSV